MYLGKSADSLAFQAEQKSGSTLIAKLNAMRKSANDQVHRNSKVATANNI
jgi:hypothetical protein